MARPHGRLNLVLAMAIVSAIAAGAGAKTTTLSFWTDHSTDDMPLLQRVIGLFEAKNPGIKVKMSNAGSAYYDRLMAAGAAGVLPDVFYTRGGSGDARFYARGLALDLTPFVKRDWAEIDGSDFLDSEVTELKYKGKWMALPYDYSTLGTYYNVTMLSQAGVPLFGNSVTWDEVTIAGLKVAKVDASGKRTRTGFDNLPAPPWFTQWLEGQMLSEGARMFDDKLTKCFLDSAESLKFFSFISDLAFKQGIAPRTGDSTLGGWGSQKAAMTVTGSWATLEIRKATKFGWDVTALPCSDLSKQVTSATGGGWVISRSTKKPNEAWKFVKFLGSREAARVLVVDPIRSIPARKSLLPEWSNNIKRDNLDPKHAEALWLGVKKNGKNSPVLPFAYQPILQTMLYSIQTGKKGVDQILKTATQQMNIELDRAWKRNLL